MKEEIYVRERSVVQTKAKGEMNKPSAYYDNNII